MTAFKSRRATVLFALAASVLVLIIGSNVAGTIRDSRKVTQMTEKMKTVCVGRFLIDLPQAAEYSRGQVFIDGFYVTGFPESADEFTARVAAREAEINSVRNQFGRKNMESVTKFAANGFAGKVFVFGRNSDYVMHGDKKVVLEGIVLEGYVHSSGLSFDFISKGYDPALAGNLVRLMNQLRLTASDEIPKVPGFCFGPGMFLEPLTADQGESMTMFAALPGHPDLAIRFATMAGLKGSRQGLLERNTEAEAGEPLWVRALFKNIREGKRVINGLPGEELGLRVTELNFSTVFGLDWEMMGTETDVLAPFLHLEMKTGHNPNPNGKPVQSSLSQTAVLALWDRISSSIRLRPSEPVKAVAAEPVVPPLGTYASAGEVCPQSGWWQCNEGGNGVGVLGGQRQYFKKGQRMPQALLLPPQSLWEKVKGVQPSFESSTRTSWKLVDKRGKARTAPQVPLAQATMVSEASAVTTGAETPMGSYVKTGTVCPASGWWRCEESAALDGTRWFAQGSLLPAATFALPSGMFGAASAGPKVIQRRSVWHLVRHAVAPEPTTPLPTADNAPAKIPNEGGDISGLPDSSA